MSDPLGDDIPLVERLEKELALLQTVWKRVRRHRNGQNGQPTGEKKATKDRMQQIEKELVAARRDQNNSVAIAGGVTTQSVTAAAAATAQPVSAQPSAVNSGVITQPARAQPISLPVAVTTQPTTGQPGVVRSDTSMAAAFVQSGATGDGKSNNRSAPKMAVLDVPTAHVIPPSEEGDPMEIDQERLNSTSTVVSATHETDNFNPGEIEPMEVEVDERSSGKVTSNHISLNGMGVEPGRFIQQDIGNNASASAPPGEGTPAALGGTEGDFDRRSILVSADEIVENQGLATSAEEIPKVLGVKNVDVGGENADGGRSSIPAASKDASANMDVDDPKVLGGENVDGGGENADGGRSSIPAASKDASANMDVDDKDEGTLVRLSDEIKKEDNVIPSQWNGLDSLMKDLVMSGPHYNFILPGTAEELLSYVFRYEEVDWDDVQHPALQKKDDESKDDFALRRQLYMRAYELEYTEKQKEHLLQLYEATKDEWKAGRIEPQAGADKMKSLDPEVVAMDHRLERIQKVFKDAQEEYGRVVDLQNLNQEEKRLRVEVERLNKEILEVNDDELPALRKELVSAVNTLGEVVAKLQAGKKKRKKRDEDVEDMLYYRLDDSKRDAFLSKAKRAIAAVLNAKNDSERKKALNRIDVSVRRATRDVREFLPESSFTTKEIALIVHFTSSKNFVCRYHQRNRGHHQFDSVIDLTGIAYPKDFSSVQKRSVVPPPGHMHCGCLIDDVLLEFFWWKTIQAFSTHPKLAATRRYLTDIDIIPAKIRRYWVEHWKEATCLTIDDIYGGDVGEPGWIPRLAALSTVRQIAKLNSKLGWSITISHSTEEDAQEFANLLRQGEDLRPGAAQIELTAEEPVSRWQVKEADPRQKTKKD